METGYQPASSLLLRLMKIGSARLPVAAVELRDEMRQLGWAVEDSCGIHPEAPAAAVQAYGLGVLQGVIAEQSR